MPIIECKFDLANLDAKLVKDVLTINVEMVRLQNPLFNDDACRELKDSYAFTDREIEDAIYEVMENLNDLGITKLFKARRTRSL